MRHRRSQYAVASLVLATLPLGCRSAPSGYKAATWETVENERNVDTAPRNLQIGLAVVGGSEVKPGSPSPALVLRTSPSGDELGCELRWTVRGTVDREKRRTVSTHARSVDGKEQVESRDEVSGRQRGIKLDFTPDRLPVDVRWCLARVKSATEQVTWPVPAESQAASGSARVTTKEGDQAIVIGCDRIFELASAQPQQFRLLVRADVPGSTASAVFCGAAMSSKGFPVVTGEVTHDWKAQADAVQRGRARVFLSVAGHEWGRDESPAKVDFPFDRAPSGDVTVPLRVRIDRSVDRAVTWTCVRSGQACGKPVGPSSFVRSIDSSKGSREAFDRWRADKGLPPEPAEPQAGAAIAEPSSFGTHPVQVRWQLNRVGGSFGPGELLPEQHAMTAAAGTIVIDEDSPAVERSIVLPAEVFERLAGRNEELALVVRASAAGKEGRQSPLEVQLSCTSPFPADRFARPGPAGDEPH